MLPGGAGGAGGRWYPGLVLAVPCGSNEGSPVGDGCKPDPAADGDTDGAKGSAW